MTDLAGRLRTIAEHAKLLRDAGVSGTVTVGDVQFTVTAAEPAMVALTAADSTSPRALDDAATYGWPEGTPPPGFKRPGGERKGDV